MASDPLRPNVYIDNGNLLNVQLAQGGKMQVDGQDRAPVLACLQVALHSYTANATAPTANNLNLVGADICGGSIKKTLNLTAALAAGATATLPTVAALVTALQAAGINPQAGETYEFELMNTSSGNFAWTITTNTGWTLTGTMTVAQNTFRKCYITLTSLTAATLQSLGQYAIGAGI